MALKTPSLCRLLRRVIEIDADLYVLIAAVFGWIFVCLLLSGKIG